jgi:hypothetical protein
MCNNIISTLIMVLYALYVCLLHSRFNENHPMDLEVTNPSFLGGPITCLPYSSGKMLASTKLGECCPPSASCSGSVLDPINHGMQES